MTNTTIHNPDGYMVDLRQILSQGKKRIGLLLGAGAPTAIKLDNAGKIADEGAPLIPDVARLTTQVVSSLNASDQALIEKLKSEFKNAPNIEAILTRVRRLAEAIGVEKIHNCDGPAYTKLAERICEKIGKVVSKELPSEPNPYTELVSWIGGTHREHPIEIFTPNYDLLLEEAFERARLPYFDGFTGSHCPFFDPASVADEKLPVRWSRVWKLHGSLGWDLKDGSIIRPGGRTSTRLIYPDHLKYDQVTRQPYSALFDRLREFLTTPDSLLICSGFSFFDSHICAVLDESLISNTHTAILAFQYRALKDESLAVKLALHRPNLSVYARDGAVIYGVQGRWQPGRPPNEEWPTIRQTFWKAATAKSQDEFLLGCFAKLARFFSLTQASRVESVETHSTDGPEPEGASSSWTGSE